MKRTVRQDPFFLDQPPLAFLEELRSPMHHRPVSYGSRDMAPGEIDARGIHIAEHFPDGEELLRTVYEDFDRFTAEYGIGGQEYPVYLRKTETECFETWSAEISEEGVIIAAADTEGIRRGVIWLEDELRRREAAFLAPGRISRIPKIRSRITRCFFSPINRPPKYGDELSDGIDYYPEEYLNQLMHDGVNGVWIYSRFSDLVPSPIIEEYGKGHEPRIAKLNRVIEKCARYGIGVYLFAIEPYHLSPELAAKYPDLAGAPVYTGGRAFCVRSEKGKEMIRLLGRDLCRMAPGLKGFISITYGERPTACSSVYPDLTCPHGTDCPGCGGEYGKLLSESVETLRSGFREENPDCEVISWTYGHRLWKFGEIRDYVRTAPGDVMLMQNFDDMGYEDQLGEIRQAVDYWLSYVGPSEMFRITAEEVSVQKKHIFAKMQVCCSHEIASVPYIPVPGIIWDKYKGARELGVEGVMQCWYFGNYPSLMSKAAGELSFEECFSDKDNFLENLAGIYWGQSKAKAVSEAWKAFEAGYRQYPMNVMFSYYGPMHDSVVWKMALQPKNFSLPRSWQTLDPVDGDRIGEALLNGHTLEEALELAERMCVHWKDGIRILEGLDADSHDAVQDLSVAKALDLLLRGGRGILEFYRLRDLLGRETGNSAALLAQMKKLVEEQIVLSAEMISLCESDGRLGYHSEGEGYKFFPKKLRDRIDQLRQMLREEFPETEARIVRGEASLPYYRGEEDWPELKRYRLAGSLDKAVWENFGDEAGSRFRAASDGEKLFIEFCSDGQTVFSINPEYRLFTPDAGVDIAPDGSVKLQREAYLYYSLFGERAEQELRKYSGLTTLEGEGTHHLLELDLKELGLDRLRPMKMKLRAGETSWCSAGEGAVTLGKNEVVPEQYGWWIPEK